MKKFYLFILVLVTHFLFSQNFTDTKGELQISASGSATYNLPIATPPSIKNVAPIINLTYNSGVRGGIAGQGWSINSISAISRMATRRDIDGFVDGVDFDDSDKLALDGQRLLIKTGTYWVNGSTYETEYKSNTKIELKIEGSITYFIVTTPDGSRSWYGSKGAGSLQNSASLNSWYIVRYEDVNGNFIDYNYKTVTYNNSNQLYIDTIVFSGNTVAGIAAQDKISFTYKDSKRIERDYLKGVPVYATQVLDNIKVYANNSLFRTYKLTHIEDTVLGYERIKSIQEINAQNEESNPVVFEYAHVAANRERTEKEYTNDLAFDETQLAGDFDGDGRLDFVADSKIYTNLFADDKGNKPISLPFIVYGKDKIFSATVLTNNKLNQFNTIIGPEVGLNSLTFKYYNLIAGSVSLSYSKKVELQNIVLNSVQCSVSGGKEQLTPDFPEEINVNNQYIEGDFNGDGISEVIIMQFHQIDYYENDGPCQGPRGEAFICDCILQRKAIADCATRSYLLNLNPNGSTDLGTKDFVVLTDFTFCKDTEKLFTGDFNGDGKTDVLIVNNISKAYRIVSFVQLMAAPWVAVEVIGRGVLDKYSTTKQMLLGDFNGDGKTDIMLPDSEGGEGQIKWHIYYSNANSTGGEFFTKESLDVVEYRPDTSKDGSNFKTQVQFSNYYAMDINGDGKSDLVRVWRNYYKPEWTINDHNTQWQVTAFANNIGKVGVAGFTQTYDSGVFTSGSPEIPIPIPSNYKYNGANTDLVLVRGHKNLIEYYQFNKNVDAENRLISVTESSGNIKQSIEYKKMEAADGKFGNSETDFYSSANNVTYPNIEIQRNSTSYLVSRLTATINGVSKYQDFRYRGFVSNFNYGTIGFTKTTRSSWYLNNTDPKIWTTQYNDALLRGANTVTWTSTEGLTVFNTTPTNLLSTKTNEFAVYTKGGDVPSSTYQNEISIINPVSASQNFIANNLITASSVVNDNLAVNYKASHVVLKPGFNVKATNGSSFIANPLVDAGSASPSNSSVYNVLLTKQTTVDHLTDVKTETSFTYDGTVESANYFGLEIKSITKQFSGSVLQGTTIIDKQYDNNATGVAAAYYVGRPKKVNTSTNIYTGDTRNAEETYTYTGSNLTRTEKKGIILTQ